MTAHREEKMDDDDIDDAPPPFEAPLKSELVKMNEGDWLLLKNELQEYLHRIEQSENPAYENASIVNWLDENGEHFDRFYQLLRNTNPKLLLRFRENALDEDEANDTQFVREWVAFRDAQ